MKKRIFAALLVLLLLLCACGAEEPWQAAYRRTGQALAAQEDYGVGSIGGEWAVIGLSRSGLLKQETAQAYLQTVEDYVRSIGTARLDHAKSTENSRIILGVTAAGGDVTLDIVDDLGHAIDDRSMQFAIERLRYTVPKHYFDEALSGSTPKDDDIIEML